MRDPPSRPETTSLTKTAIGEELNTEAGEVPHNRPPQAVGSHRAARAAHDDARALERDGLVGFLHASDVRGTSGTGTITLQIAATFSATGVTGTAVLGGACQLTEHFTGMKQ